ncbi:MAG: thioredoxin-dependent thiol peroxidase [Candidatus Goldbacteria bacterium]|nr:thioredoxin-dependent thiol peroxidase [Candidatus Goldiibacteriota bacterium]
MKKASGKKAVKGLKKIIKKAVKKSNGKAALKTGDIAPAFCLKDSAEKNVCLKDFKGRWVVLYFYPKDNTPGCTIEARDFSKELSGFEELGCEVLGISGDSCESHRKFIKNHNLKLTLLSDESKNVLKVYGVWQKKNMMGREYMGIVRTTILIDPKGKIASVWEKVSVAGHAAEVLMKLKETGAN